MAAGSGGPVVPVSQFVSKLGAMVCLQIRQAKITQLRLADPAGVGRSTFSDLEKGGTRLGMDSTPAVLSVLNITSGCQRLSDMGLQEAR